MNDDASESDFRHQPWSSDCPSHASNGLPDYFPQADARELSELRKRLKEMKELLGDEDIDLNKLSSPKKSSFLDGNMVSLVFAVAMGLILSVTVYAFQHLYTAVMKRFTPP